MTEIFDGVAEFQPLLFPLALHALCPVALVKCVGWFVYLAGPAPLGLNLIEIALCVDWIDPHLSIGPRLSSLVHRVLPRLFRAFGLLRSRAPPTSHRIPNTCRASVWLPPATMRFL